MMTNTDFCNIVETEDGRIKLEFDLTHDQVSLIKEVYSVDDLSEEVMLKFVYDALENYAKTSR